MYTHNYSFDPDTRLYIHSVECTVRLLNQAGRNKYPYNPKFVENTGNRTRDLWFDKCISNQQLYHLSHSTIKNWKNYLIHKNVVNKFFKKTKFLSQRCQFSVNF